MGTWFPRSRYPWAFFSFLQSADLGETTNRYLRFRPRSLLSTLLLYCGAFVFLFLFVLVSGDAVLPRTS